MFYQDFVKIDWFLNSISALILYIFQSYIMGEFFPVNAKIWSVGKNVLIGFPQCTKLIHGKVIVEKWFQVTLWNTIFVFLSCFSNLHRFYCRVAGAYNIQCFFGGDPFWQIIDKDSRNWTWKIKSLNFILFNVTVDL